MFVLPLCGIGVSGVYVRQGVKALLQLLVRGDVVGHLAVVVLLIGYEVEISRAGQAEEYGLGLARSACISALRLWPP